MRCFAAREQPDHQPPEVHLQPGGGEVFGTLGFGLRDPPAPWPHGGGHPVSMPVVTPRTSMFPWACELLPPVFAWCCRFSAPSDRHTSGSWQDPGLVPADGAGLQCRQNSPGCRRQVGAPAGRLPHQLDGRHVRHSQHSAVLQHFRRSSWAPLSFFSKKLSPAETRYRRSTGSFWLSTPPTATFA